MMRLYLLISAFWVAVVTSSDKVEKTWTLSHSNGIDPPTVRGTVRLSIDETVQLTMEDQDSSKMAELVNNKFYQLILKDNTDKEAPIIRTSITACQLLRANLRDELVLMFGSKGMVMSMSYMPMVSALAPPTCEDLELTNDEFSTKIDYEMDEPGMQLKKILPAVNPPPGLTFLSGTNKRAPAGGAPPTGGPGGGFQKEPEAPQGLFGYLTKYWYIVVPLMLMNFLAETPREDGETTKEGQPAAPTAGAAAPAAAAKPSSSSKSRRGKRG